MSSRPLHGQEEGPLRHGDPVEGEAQEAPGGDGGRTARVVVCHAREGRNFFTVSVPADNLEHAEEVAREFVTFLLNDTEPKLGEGPAPGPGNCVLARGLDTSDPGELEIREMEWEPKTPTSRPT